MANRSSAGVYTKEDDRSQSVTRISTAVTAMLGESRRGPVGVRTLVTSTQNFIDLFGRPDPSLGFLHYSALAFLNEGNRLYVTRVAPNALFGGVVVSIGNGSLSSIAPWVEGLAEPEVYNFQTEDLFAVSAANPGVWNQEVSVQIYPNTANDDGTFYVDVYTADSGIAKESYLVHLNYIVDGYGNQINIAESINKKSKLIRIIQNLDQANYVINPNTKFINTVMEEGLLGGTDGTRATTGNFVQAWDLYSDSDRVLINILVSAGLAAPAIQQKMDQICQTRQDCMAILDVPPTEQSVSSALNYRLNSLNINSSYSALYSCDLYILDPYSNRRLYVPPSGYVAACYAATDRDYATWFAPAGMRRGKLSVLGVRHKYNQGDRDTLVESQINPIRVVEGNGIMVWGADTLQTKQSALSNVNVRRLMLFLETSLSITALYSVFDPNDEILRSKLVESARRFLETVKNGEGVYRYGVQCDDDNNPPESIAAGDLTMDLYVDPVLPAKRILFTAVINKTGAKLTAE